MVLGLSLAACGSGDEESQPESTPVETAQIETSGFYNVREEVAYAGDDACFSCHEDLYRGYQAHGMAQSYYPLTPENVVEDFSGVTLTHEASGFSYRIYSEGNRFFQEEFRRDEAGQKTHQLVREMQYVVGSGTAARTYLTEQNGRLYELPVTWYTQQQRWDFSPGYDEQNGRFDRLVPDRCMACHNSYPESVPFAEGKYTSVPDGIGCERCHGPGELHVEARLADPEPATAVDSTIVNPAHLSLDRRLDVCQQCHLSTTVSFLREGREAFDFLPSQPLAAHLVLFAAETPETTDQISVISHADRMQRSACFIATQQTTRPLDCVTCHDPHEGFRTKGPAYFNETCQSCHAPAALHASFETEETRAIHTASADCYSCHMPKVDVEEAPHSSFTDHWIRVVAKEPALPAPAATHEPPVLRPYFDRDEASPLYEGMAYLVYGTQQGDTLALRKGITQLESVLAEDPEHGEAQFLTGLTRLNLGEVQQAIPLLEAAVRIDPSVPERLNTLAQAYERARRDPAKITQLYEQALSIQPALADVRLNYGRFLETQGRLGEAVVQYQQAVEEQPWLEKAHYNLGTAYLQQGQFQEAETLLKQAVELNPDYTEARGNLGLYYATQGQMEQAREQFEQAVAAAPDNATALGNLGTFYLNIDNLPRAIDLLERAVAVNPVYLDGLLNLSLAHFRNEDYALARTYAEKVLAIDPNNDRARQILEAL